MSQLLIENVTDLKKLDFDKLRTRLNPQRLLMCPPEFFNVEKVKNEFMKGNIGQTNKDLAMRQWDKLVKVLSALGCQIEIIPPVPKLEDMTFSANCGITWQEPGSSFRYFLASNMSAQSHRQQETKHYTKWFQEQNDCLTRKLSRPTFFFEGGGDAIWYPEKMLLFGGYGHRTVKDAYREISHRFNIPIITLELTSQEFYHLDTCFCILDKDTVLFCKEAFSTEGQELIEKIFSRKIYITPEQGIKHFTGNCFCVRNSFVVMQKGNNKTVRELEDIGFYCIEVDLSEFVKSGGNVTCLKMDIY